MKRAGLCAALLLVLLCSVAPSAAETQLEPTHGYIMWDDDDPMTPKLEEGTRFEDIPLDLDLCKWQDEQCLRIQPAARLIEKYNYYSYNRLWAMFRFDLPAGEIESITDRTIARIDPPFPAGPLATPDDPPHEWHVAYWRPSVPWPEPDPDDPDWKLNQQHPWMGSGSGRGTAGFQTIEHTLSAAKMAQQDITAGGPYWLLVWTNSAEGDVLYLDHIGVSVTLKDDG